MLGYFLRAPKKFLLSFSRKFVEEVVHQKCYSIWMRTDFLESNATNEFSKAQVCCLIRGRLIHNDLSNLFGGGAAQRFLAILFCDSGATASLDAMRFLTATE